MIYEEELYMPEKIQGNKLLEIQHYLRNCVPLTKKQKEYIPSLDKKELIELVELYNVILERMNRIILEIK